MSRAPLGRAILPDQTRKKIRTAAARLKRRVEFLGGKNLNVETKCLENWPRVPEFLYYKNAGAYGGRYLFVI